MTQPILIVGAGPAGLAAAHALARVGQRSVLVEREDRLGGAPILSGYARLVPSGEWAKDAIGGMVRRVETDALVEVRTGVKVTAFEVLLQLGDSAGGALAESAAVVEEFHQGDIAGEIAADRGARIVEQLILLGGEGGLLPRLLFCFSFGFQCLQRLFNDLRMCADVLLYHLIAGLLTDRTGRCCRSGASDQRHQARHGKEGSLRPVSSGDRS